MTININQSCNTQNEQGINNEIINVIMNELIRKNIVKQCILHVCIQKEN